MLLTEFSVQMYFKFWMRGEREAKPFYKADCQTATRKNRL